MSKLVNIRTVLAAFALWGASSAVLGDVFVYQLPGGARIVTDHQLNNRDYRLVRQSKDSKGAGTLISGRKIQYAVTDPTAYDRLIRRTASAHEVDPALVKAVMHIESGFNPHAISDKGALGLMQVMPETGQRYGAEDLFDPVQNVRAAVLYIRDLQKRFKNNTRLVLAAYNAGENAVTRHNGIPPYDETRDYVRKVIKMHHAYTAEAQALQARRNIVLAAASGPVAGPTVVAVSAPVAAPSPAAAGIVPVMAVQPVVATPPEKNL